MLNKAETKKGAQIVVRSDKPLKDGLPSTFGGGEEIEYITLQAGAGTSIFGGTNKILPGDILTVVDGPKRRNGINTTIVQTASGLQGHVYWCELRTNCHHIHPTDELV
jgi:hypothetical protein